MKTSITSNKRPLVTIDKQLKVFNSTVLPLLECHEALLQLDNTSVILRLFQPP